MSDVVDSLGMLDAALGLADRVDDAARAAATLALPEGTGSVSSVLLAASGDDARVAHAVAALAGPGSRVPLVVHGAGPSPGFVGPDTLVVVVSWSGGDPQPLATARDAVARGARVLAVGGGAALAALVSDHSAPHLRLDAGLPAARAAVVPGVVAALSVLARAGLVDPALVPSVAVAEQLRRRGDELTGPAGTTARLARSVGRTLPIVYGVGPLGAVAAEHWKSRCNQDPKVPAFANSVPSLVHDEVAGWAQHGDVTRQVFSVVLLRHDHEQPDDARAMDLVGELCEEVVAGVHEVRASGEGPLAQLADLLLVGDAVALRMAALAGVDPGPVPVLDDLARSLGSPPAVS